MISGTIIGAGLFSLPYITYKVGVWVILGYFLVLGIVVSLIHSFFGELALQTPDFKRLPGFAKIHLGSWAERIIFVTTIFGLFGSLLAYLILGGQFLEGLLSPFLGGAYISYVLLYLVLGSILIFLGINIVAKIELFGLLGFFIVLILMFVKGFPHITLVNLMETESRGFSLANFFLPFGPIFFALWGPSLIPEAEEILGKDRKTIKNVVLVASLIPIVIYLLFIILILGITGANTTESALIGLNGFLGRGIFSLGLLFGLLTTFTSFIALGLTLKNVFLYDLKIKKPLAWLITCSFPLILFLLGFNKFIPVISFIGGVLLAFEGIMILLMYRKINPTNRLVFPLILILMAGIIYQIAYSIK